MVPMLQMLRVHERPGRHSTHMQRVQKKLPDFHDGRTGRQVRRATTQRATHSRAFRQIHDTRAGQSASNVSGCKKERYDELISKLQPESQTVLEEVEVLVSCPHSPAHPPQPKRTHHRPQPGILHTRGGLTAGSAAATRAQPPPTAPRLHTACLYSCTGNSRDPLSSVNASLERNAYYTHSRAYERL